MATYVFNEEHQQQKMNPEVLPPDAEQLKAAQILLIRHATTEFNKEQFKMDQQYARDSQEYRHFRVRRDLMDPGLSEVGDVQCGNGREHISKINFKVVVVSAMFRAMKTAIEMFKDHPAKASIKFVVLPLVKETMNNSNDFMAGDFRTKIVSHFGDSSKVYGLNFDFSYVLGCHGCESLMQIETLADISALQKTLAFVDEAQFKDEQGTQDEAVEMILTSLFQQFPLRLEENKQTYMRARQVKQFLSHFLATQDLQPEEKVGIVSHGAFLRCLSADGFDTETLFVTNACDLRNCEIRPVPGLLEK